MSLAEVHETRYRNQFNTPWTDKAKQLLTELWRKDIPLERIAEALNAELGTTWTRSCVHRKADRLGLRRRRPNETWTPELTARLAELWADRGMSGADIAHSINKEFCTRFTRCAILGTVQRLKLPKRGNGKITDPEILAQRRLRQLERGRKYYARNRDKVLGRMRQYYERMRTRATAPDVLDLEIPQEQRKGIYDLGPHDCRWPVGEPNTPSFFFCGAISENDRPYCSAHCRRAYAQINPR